MSTYGHGGDIYALDRPVLDFSININPLGMPEAVKEAICSHAEDYAVYPDTHCRAQRAAHSAPTGVPAEQILCGNGASDLIFRLCHTLRPKETLVCAPTFSDYERDAVSAGSRIRRHTLRAEDDFLITEAILSDITEDTDLVFLCNPNNPTGQVTDSSLIRRIADRCREMQAFLLIDECFLCFTGRESFLGQRKPEDTHVLVLNAFTKQYSMAGIRLGWLVCSDEALLSRLEDAAPYWNVSTVAQVAGIAALDCGDWFRESLELLKEERPWLAEALAKLGIRVFPGQANYLLLHCPEEVWGNVYERLLAEDILIRPCGNYHGLNEEYYRVCVSRHPDNEKLVQAFAGLKG